MSEKQPSQTALIVAWTRAIHAEYVKPPIFDDFMAGRLISAEDGRRLMAMMRAMFEPVYPQLGAMDDRTAKEFLHRNGPANKSVISRARYNEDRLMDAIASGISQYVIVGAGLDTFALRRPDLANQIDVFELDHPASQTDKQRRIGEAGLTLPRKVHLVPCDLEAEAFSEALGNTAFDAAKPTFFSWLGVTIYLTKDAIESTLRSIRSLCALGSELVLDYADELPQTASVSAEDSLAQQAVMNAARSLGEPMLSSFGREEMGELIRSTGFELREQLGRAEQEERYFRGRSDDFHLQPRYRAVLVNAKAM